MAETFANAYGSDVVEAGSAGFAPARQVSHTARRLMFEKGVPMADAPPRRWSQTELDSWDLIVNLCEFGLPKTSVPVVKIPLADPVGKPEEERREVRDRIEILVQVMLAQFRQAREEWPWNSELTTDVGRGASSETARPETVALETAAPETAPEHLAMLSWWRTRPASAQLPLEGLPV